MSSTASVDRPDTAGARDRLAEEDPRRRLRVLLLVVIVFVTTVATGLFARYERRRGKSRLSRSAQYWRSVPATAARRGSERRPDFSEMAAATPAPCPLTVQHIMFRTAACDTLSPPMHRPAAIK